MKKLFVLGICALFVACGGATENTTTTDSTLENMDTVTAAEMDSAINAVTPPVSADNTQSPPAPVTDNKGNIPAGTPKTEPAKPAAAADNSAEIKKGEALIAKSDCLACHQLKVKVIGPAYADVSKKYETTAANITYLANKVIKGGGGVWGDIPMTPHPQVPLEDAKAMAQYVLSIK